MPENHSANNKRIAKNTAFLYVRMIITLLVLLYTSRVVLRVLGVTDFGIYNAVGGVVTLLSFINSSMSIAVQRYLSFDLGKADIASLNKTFNLALLIHFVIAVVVALLAETAGYYLLTHYMKFPPERYDAVLWVFHFSILTCCVRMLQVPYNALVIAFERMGIFAYLSIGEAVLGLSILYILQLGDFDRLKLYAVLVFVVATLITALYALYTSFKIKEIKIRPTWDRPLFQKLLSFASWSALGEMAWAGTMQGVNIVLNIFFGPVVNAARGIAYQVLGAINRFVQGFLTAVNPQVIKRYASGNVQGTFSLTYRAICFSFYLLLFLSLPVILRTEYVLGLWLGQVPPHLVAFCQLALVGTGIDALSNPLATVAKAYGKIRAYQLTVSAILILNLPLSYLGLKLGLRPESSFVIYLFVSAMLIVTRLILLKKMVGMQATDYIRQVAFPIAKWIAVALPVPFILNYFIPQNFGGFVCTTLLSCLCLAIATFFIGLKHGERIAVIGKVKNLIHRNQ